MCFWLSFLWRLVKLDFFYKLTGHLHFIFNNFISLALYCFPCLIPYCLVLFSSSRYYLLPQIEQAKIFLLFCWLFTQLFPSVHWSFVMPWHSVGQSLVLLLSIYSLIKEKSLPTPYLEVSSLIFHLIVLEV